jgi:hypothetical protein
LLKQKPQAIPAAFVFLRQWQTDKEVKLTSLLTRDAKRYQSFFPSVKLVAP